MPVILYCMHCGHGFGAVGEIPITCPACARETTWIVSPFSYTRDDRIFLKVNRIAQD